VRVEEVTRSFADAGDALRYRTEQLDEPSHMIFVPRVTLSTPRVKQEVAGRQLERLQQYAQLNEVTQS